MRGDSVRIQDTHDCQMNCSFDVLASRGSRNSPSPQPSPRGRGGKYGALVVISMVLAFACPALAEDWPMWRGPGGDGISKELFAPTKWSNTQNVRWKTATPGKGHSSPIVCGDRIFLTTCLEDSLDRQVV
jgi:hypothetical protein